MRAVRIISPFFFLLLQLPVISTLEGQRAAINVDDYSSVQAALDFAANGDNRVTSVLFSPNKTYYLTGAGAGAAATHILLLNNANDLRIDGQNASIIVSDPSKGVFSITHCTNIVLANINIDYSPRPNAQGTCRLHSLHVVLTCRYCWNRHRAQTSAPDDCQAIYGMISGPNILC